MKKYLILFFIGLALGFLVYGFVHFNKPQSYSWAMLSAFFGVLITYLVHYSNRLIDKAIPWKRHLGLRLFIGILVHLTIVALLVYGFLWTQDLLSEKPTLLTDSDNVFTKIGILLFFILLLYNIFYFAYYSYFEYSKGQLLEIKLKRKQTELQLKALKSQLSPHFLFNSMNTLSSLFLKDTGKAESFIRSLANSYHYVLGMYNSPLVTIAEELEFVKTYSFLIKTRFGEHLHLNTGIPSDVLQSKIPPLTLQMLVENAIKHNVISENQPLEIVMTVKKNTLIVSNNKTEKRPKISSLKIGLQNIASRYELLCQKSIEVNDGTNFTVTLPLIQ